jgi:hypothetical protein
MSRNNLADSRIGVTTTTYFANLVLPKSIAKSMKPQKARISGQPCRKIVDMCKRLCRLCRKNNNLTHVPLPE